MVDEDCLKAAFFCPPEDEIEKAKHGHPLFVAYASNFHLLGTWRIMSFGGLIENEEAWDWSIPLSEPAMESHVCNHMAPDPIVTAAHVLQFYSAVRRVCDDRQALEI